MSADVIEWLRSPEGRQWSCAAHGFGGAPSGFVPSPQTLWRATGPLDSRHDPAGAPPLDRAQVTGRRP